MPMLETEALTKHFGGLAAVADVDLAVEQGETVGLIGPNGAGKTTLFNLVSGALKPDSGRIRFKGRDITGSKPHQICKAGISRTFQSVKIFGNMSVQENVRLGALFGKGRSPTPSILREDELLDFVGLSDVRLAHANDLTLVRQKQVEVARAMATRPELLLLDEFMAGLNPAEVAESMDLVARIRRRGITVFMIEHVMKAIMGMCDRIIVLDHGEKIADGNPREIASNKMVVEVYLGESADAGNQQP